MKYVQVDVPDPDAPVTELTNSAVADTSIELVDADATAVQHRVESFEDLAGNHETPTVRRVVTACGQTFRVRPDRVSEGENPPASGTCPLCFG